MRTILISIMEINYFFCTKNTPEVKAIYLATKIYLVENLTGFFLLDMGCGLWLLTFGVIKK